VIDFDRAEPGPAVRDLVRLEYEPQDQRPDLPADFLSGYGRALTRAEEQVLPRLAALDALSGLQWGTLNGDTDVTSRARRAFARLTDSPDDQRRDDDQAASLRPNDLAAVTPARSQCPGRRNRTLPSIPLNPTGRPLLGVPQQPESHGRRTTGPVPTTWIASRSGRRYAVSSHLSAEPPAHGVRVTWRPDCVRQSPLSRFSISPPPMDHCCSGEDGLQAVT
jgi:hypothetical protein